jgi:hypothetical protein
MTIDDNDDAVVPSGSRRSSYVPPAEESSGEAIDIPRLVVSGDIPEARASNESVPDLQRNVNDDVETGEIPIPVEVVEANITPALSVPTRQSLTPEELTQALDPAAGLSSDEQMALLDSQIALREADADAATRFLDAARAAGTPEAVAMFDEAKMLFADVAPELVAVRITPAEVVDPVEEPPTEVDAAIESVPEVELAEIDSEPVMSVDESQSDDVVGEVPSADPLESIVEADGPVGTVSQSWSLDAPASIPIDEDPAVKRLHLTTVAATVSVALTALMLTFSAGLEPQSLIGIGLAALVVAVGLVFGARHLNAHTGSTLRATVESMVGSFAGKTLLAVAGLGGVSALSTAIASFMEGVADNEATAGVVTRLGDVVGPVTTLATVAVLGLSVALSMLPLRAFRAILLIGVGFTVVGTGAVVGMSGFLVAASETWELPSFESAVTSAGFVMTLTLVIVGIALAAVHSLTREHEGVRNGTWLAVGAGVGFLAAAATIALALIASEADHYFFANNSLVHIVSSSAPLAVILGAVVSGVALVVTTTLVVRGALMFTVKDDRDEPSVVWKLVAFAAVAAVGAMLFVSLDDKGVVSWMPDAALSLAPTAGVAAVALAIVLGLALANSMRTEYRSTPARRVVLALVSLAVLATALGYSTGSGLAWSWVGFVNEPLTALGFGLLYIDAVIPVATMLVVAFVSLAAMIQREPRAVDSAVQD